MHTAQHIVNNCFSGPLATDRTFVLVTHHVSLCAPRADYFVELKGGQALHHGTKEELRSQGVLEAILKKTDVTFADYTETPISPIMDEPKSFTIPKPLTAVAKLIEVEHQEEGRVSLGTYLTYIKAAGYVIWLGIFSLVVFGKIASIGSQVCSSDLPRLPVLSSLVGFPCQVG